jgi:hypothetical protein
MDKPSKPIYGPTEPIHTPLLYSPLEWGRGTATCTCWVGARGREWRKGGREGGSEADTAAR